MCLVCGEVQRRFDVQAWQRIIGYNWDGDGRSPCPGKPQKQGREKRKKRGNRCDVMKRKTSTKPG